MEVKAVERGEEEFERVKKEVEKLADKIAELLNGLEKDEDRAAAAFVALGLILSHVDVTPFAKAGVLYALRLALDEVMRQIIRETEPAEYIL